MSQISLKRPQTPQTPQTLSSVAIYDPCVHQQRQNSLPNLTKQSQSKPSPWKRVAVGALAGGMVGLTIGASACKIESAPMSPENLTLLTLLGAYKGAVVGGFSAL